MVNCSTGSRLGSIFAKCASKPVILVDPCPVPQVSPVIVGVVVAIAVYALTKKGVRIVTNIPRVIISIVLFNLIAFL